MSRSRSGNSSLSDRLLLDTHVFLWAAAEPEQLPAKARKVLESSNSELYLSAASVWELLIKAQKRKIDLGGEPVVRIREFCRHLRALPLPVRDEHLFVAFQLKGLHKDPFDRVLVAQAKIEGLSLVTRDRILAKYGVETIW